MSALDHIDASGLSVSETARLARLEIVIEDGLATFVKVGGSLLEIQSKRLYREAHDTFEDYCQERWNFSRQYAHLVMAEATVNQLVDTPLRQSQARELVPLLDQPEQLQEALTEASANGKPTAKKLRDVVQRRLGRPGPKTADRQARDTGEAVLGSDGEWHMPHDPPDSSWMGVQMWADELDKMPPPDSLAVPSYGQTTFWPAVDRLHTYLAVLLTRKETA